MKKTLATALVALTMLGAVAGCGARADRQGRGGRPSVQQTASQPAPAQRPDQSAADADLASVDALLGDIDSDLASADKTPEDAD